jgi:4-diphosphocytidyl-2-C-methyl-D-erythritol kinase
LWKKIRLYRGGILVRASAPAKINLSLKVTGRRDDGYHFIHTVMQAVSVRETVELKKNGKSGIDLSMTGAKLSPDVTNIAYRAADAFFEYTGIKAFGIDIKIHKTVPIGAGLAGGSADAAAVLAGLNALTDARLPVSELCKIGAQVGADVPFCILGGTALATGVGTDLTVLPPIPDCFFVIAKPEESISTAEAYRLIDSADSMPDPAVSIEDAVKAGDILMVARGLSNDFETVTNLPGVGDIKRIMEQNKALGCRMTGSGSAVFAIFSDRDTAERCKTALQSGYKDVFLCLPDREGARVEQENY